MRKFACFAFLALSALAEETGPHVDLSSPAGASGFGVVWTSPGQIGTRVRIQDSGATSSHGIYLSIQPEGDFAGGRANVGSFETDDRGAGVGGGFVDVDPAWDADGDGIIHVQLFVQPGGGNRPGGPPLSSDVFALELR